MNKKIACFISDWDYDLVTRLMDGIMKFSDGHQDVALHIFLELGKYGKVNPTLGGNAIFSLPDIDAYDGFFFQGNQSWPGADRQKAVDRIRAFGKPVVSVNYPLRDALYVGTNNSEPVSELVRIAYEKYHARTFGFVRGLARSKEAAMREQGFLEGCRSCGIPEEDITIYEGSWDTSDGVRVANEFLAKTETMPDALICANDALACGAARTLKNAGVRVPEDIFISGYDNQDQVRDIYPYIPSVERDIAGIADMALESLLRLICGERVEGPVYSRSVITNIGDDDPAAHLGKLEQISKRYYRMRREEEYFYALRDEMEPGFINIQSMADLMTAFERFAPAFGADDVVVAVNSDYRYGNAKEGGSSTFSEYLTVTGAWGSHVEKTPDPVTHIYEIYKSCEVLPQDLRNCSKTLVVTPLHFGEKIIGILGFSSVPRLVSMSSVKAVRMMLENAIENVRQRNVLRLLNVRLEDQSVRDQLTGLYNRFGLNSRGRRFFERIRPEGSVTFWFIDIDNMKSINDGYGHETGDAAIRTVGIALSEIANTYGLFAMRYGGDEFLMFGNEEPDVISDMIRKSIESMNVEGYPKTLGVSIGSKTFSESEEISLEECVAASDELMYEEKRRHKAGRGGRPEDSVSAAGPEGSEDSVSAVGQEDSVSTVGPEDSFST